MVFERQRFVEEQSMIQANVVLFQKQNNRKKTYNSNFHPNTRQISRNGKFSGGTFHHSNNQNFKTKNSTTGHTINNSGNSFGTFKPQC